MNYIKTYKEYRNCFGKEKTNKSFVVMIITIVTLIFSSIINYYTGYIGGMIIKFFIGDSVIKAINIVFNTTRFTTEQIPIICGTLSIIGGYFK